MSHRVVLGLGSNVSFNGWSGPGLLVRACVRLSRIISGMKASAVYRTAAMYVTDQDDFFNMVIAGRFEGSPESLLKAIHSIEAEFGRDRKREVRNGPRPLDIDIELFARRRIVSGDLTVPHERMTERAFVLKPLLDVLDENADIDMWSKGFYREKLREAGNQKIELYMTALQFKNLMKNIRLEAKRNGRN